MTRIAIIAFGLYDMLGFVVVGDRRVEMKGF